MWSRKAKLLAAMGVATLVAAVWADSPRLELMGFVLLASILLEWLRFRAASISHGLTMERSIEGLARAGCCWIDDRVAVTVTLRAKRGWPHLELRDLLPSHFQPEEEAAAWTATLAAKGEASWTYRARALRVGHASFPGVSCTLVGWGGLFYQPVFIERPVHVSVYPEVFRKRTTPAFIKKYNRFRMHGIHFHRRPGTGSELLELRDYIEGDPPQTIAWRASARRDQLVTREFESEVPIRVTVFLDGSASMRVAARGGTQLDSAIVLFSQFARLAMDARDRVGLAVFTESTESVLRPGRGRAHLFRLLETLTSYGNLSPAHSLGDLDGMFDTVERYSKIRYPRAWTPALNHFPIPLFSWDTPASLRRQSRRKKVAALLVALLGPGPASIERALVDDRFFGDLLSRFCERERIQVGRGFGEAVLDVCRAASPKLGVLARNLRYAVQRAKDNELYLIAANFAELEGRLDPVVAAAQLAIARHHRVLVVNSWLSAYFPKKEETPSDAAAALDAILRERYVRSLRSVRERFLRGGIPYVELQPEDTVAYLLAHVDRLRHLHGVPA
jgi:uncharacterized protein (DUF58 family)